MFTGIIEDIGEVVAVEPLGEGRRLVIGAPWAGDLRAGESVAVDGCCLTVVDHDAATFAVEAVRESLARTVIGAYAPGTRVHLERALALGDRLGGHLLQGHVDTVGIVQAMERQGENRYISITLPEPESLRLVAPQGSIAVQGVSLTVLGVTDGGFRVSIVPHTWEATTFRTLAPGAGVNVEFDLIARYLARLAGPAAGGSGAEG
jgi:riboflavin synthase